MILTEGSDALRLAVADDGEFVIVLLERVILGCKCGAGAAVRRGRDRLDCSAGAVVLRVFGVERFSSELTRASRPLPRVSIRQNGHTL